jgi:hypothetical protein
MTDEMDAWQNDWVRVKTRGLEASDLSTALVQRAFRGDNTFALLPILDSAADDDQRFGDIAMGALRLCAAICHRNRTPSARMEIAAALLDTEETAPARKTRTAASLISAYQMAYDVANFESIDQLDPATFHNLGATAYNQAFSDIPELADLVIVEALRLWRTLLPETSARTVKDVAKQLWSN